MKVDIKVPQTASVQMAAKFLKKSFWFNAKLFAGQAKAHVMPTLFLPRFEEDGRYKKEEEHCVKRS
eukprot:755743-Hanusia_phi.AAC.2